MPYEDNDFFDPFLSEDEEEEEKEQSDLSEKEPLEPDPEKDDEWEEE